MFQYSMAKIVMPKEVITSKMHVKVCSVDGCEILWAQAQIHELSV